MLEVVGDLSVETLFERHTEESVCRSGLPKASERETFTHTHPLVTNTHEGISIQREREGTVCMTHHLEGTLAAYCRFQPEK